MPSTRVNLQSLPFASNPIEVPIGATKLSVSINDGASFTWGNAVLRLEWSVEVGFDELGAEVDDWQAFDPTVTFTTGTRARRAIGITGTSWIRFRTTTPGATADPAAILTWRFY